MLHNVGTLVFILAMSLASTAKVIREHCLKNVDLVSIASPGSNFGPRSFKTTMKRTELPKPAKQPYLTVQGHQPSTRFLAHV